MALPFIQLTVFPPEPPPVDPIVDFYPEADDPDMYWPVDTHSAELDRAER